ncbi:MAG TPA: S8 family serine peptidase [Pyrinomonadaceae bacterium]|jgi:serine protease AprX|nr:S8 family serine peptidase [Pyrinomonadaceae bacterium]
MPETILSSDLVQALNKTDLSCHLCGRVNDQRMVLRDLPADITTLLKANAKVTDELAQVCANCIELFSRARAQIDSHHVVFEQTDHVLPTPLRLNADERFTGRGVTIAFLDSGFYAHDDLTKPENRIVAYHSIFDEKDDRTSLETTDVASWHGMMTSVVAAGNGHVSDGFYRGIAPDAKVVLVKVGRTGHIPDEHIQRGLEWVLENRKKFEIRIVNISAGGDFEQSYLDSPLCQMVERAVREGLVVVCAVGNAGMVPGHPVLPPASSPSAISVGGLDDQNSLDRAKRGMYRSSYGPTLDGLQKPEIIAPGIWVAAPILPATPTAAEAQLCSALDVAADADLRAIIDSHAGVDKDFDQARDLPIPLLRQLITIKLREGNVISPHYKYVDGTSFASPIVASVAACMLEANPTLTAPQVKRILIDTAERVPGIEVERQGWGVVVPRRAVEAALSRRL